MRDANGTLFDPKKHQIRGGKPLLKKDGTFARKKGVPVEIAQSNDGAISHDFAQNSAIPHDSGKTESAESISVSAFSIVEITEQTCAVLLGDEMEMKPEEKRRLISAWENYLATTEGISLPPWAALLGLNALYVGTRLMLPNVQARLINIWRNLNGQPPIKPAEKAA